VSVDRIFLTDDFHKTALRTYAVFRVTVGLSLVVSRYNASLLRSMAGGTPGYC